MKIIDHTTKDIKIVNYTNATKYYFLDKRFEPKEAFAAAFNGEDIYVHTSYEAATKSFFYHKGDSVYKFIGTETGVKADNGQVQITDWNILDEYIPS